MIARKSLVSIVFFFLFALISCGGGGDGGGGGTSGQQAKFEDTVKSLDTPEKVQNWINLNISYLSNEDPNYGYAPEQTFNWRTGDCEDFAIFASYFLNEHGYNTRVLNNTWGVLSPTNNLGHAVAAYELNGKYYKIGDSTYYAIQGPYNSYEEIANLIHPGGSWVVQTWQQALVANGNDPGRNSWPAPTISNPSYGDMYRTGQVIEFRGSGIDREDGNLLDNSLIWNSNIDGRIGTGTYLTKNNLSAGNHTITLTAIDGEGASVSCSIKVSVFGFTKYGANPIYGPVAGYRAVYSPFIQVEEGTFRMWHQESDLLHDHIGYSTSQDGIAFAFGGIALTHGYFDPAAFAQSGNLSCRIPDRADTWDCIHVGDPSVVKVGAQYYMFYSGAASTDGRGDIGLALSPDGMNWVKHSENPVLRRTPGSYDEWWLQTPSVIYDGSLFHMWYSARQMSPVREARIAYATSQDGINWTKQGVVLEKTIGSWDYWGVSSPEVVKIGSRYFMAYQHSTLREFGLAVSMDGRTWSKCAGNPILEANPAEWDQQIASPFLMTDPGDNLARLRIYYGGWRTGMVSLSNPARLGLAIGFADPMCR